MKKLLAFMVMFALMVTSVMGAITTTLVAPATDGTVDLSQSTYTVNISVTDNNITGCNATYLLADTETLIGTNTTAGGTSYIISWALGSVNTNQDVNVTANCYNATTSDADINTGVDLQAYASTDLDNIVIDFIGTYLVQLVALVSLIALFGLLVWFKSKGKF